MAKVHPSLSPHSPLHTLLATCTRPSKLPMNTLLLPTAPSMVSGPLDSGCSPCMGPGDAQTWPSIGLLRALPLAGQCLCLRQGKEYHNWFACIHPSLSPLPISPISPMVMLQLASVLSLQFHYTMTHHSAAQPTRSSGTLRTSVTRWAGSLLLLTTHPATAKRCTILVMGNLSP